MKLIDLFVSQRVDSFWLRTAEERDLFRREAREQKRKKKKKKEGRGGVRGEGRGGGGCRKRGNRQGGIPEWSE